MESYKKNIAILGSTGSIGTQALDVVEQYPDLFSAKILIAGSNADKLAEQALKYKPETVAIADESKYGFLANELKNTGIKIVYGSKAISDLIKESNSFEMLLNSTVGYSGLAPTLAAIDGGKEIALANKESLVVAGSLVTRKLTENNGKLYPVDSEHSAIWQCLQGEDINRVRRLVITASGGPFRNCSLEELKKVTVKEALNHPNWAMGAKITIDSATMMNKAFEIIEARWLFDLPASKIDAIVHPQSIVHSMIEFNDGALKAQLGVPDMKLPIRYALTRGERLDAPEEHLDFAKYPSLTFEKPDLERFPCLGLARHSLEKGGTEACAINAANEIAVAAFLQEKIKFTEIYPLITAAAAKATFIENPDYQDFVEVNEEARKIAESLIKNKQF